MEENLLNSIVEPFSIDALPLDFVFNNYFVNKALFRDKFDPLTNDYIIGFWIAVFCTTMMNNENKIHDVLFGILGDRKSGFKSLTVVPNGAGGSKQLLLIRNFFFNSDSRQIKHGGLSVKEREQIIGLLGAEIEEKVVQYLIYDINGCANQSENVIYQPYMELLLDVKAGDVDAQGQVEKFFGVKDFMDLLRDLMLEVSFLKNEGHYDDNIKNLIRFVKDGLTKGAAKQLTIHLDIPFEYGFTHGFFFSTYPIHRLDIKVHAYGKERNYVGLTLQKQTFVENLRDFRPAVSYDLTGAREMVDIQEDFKQKITEAVAKWGNKEETGKLLAGYVKRLMSFAEAPTPKVKDKNHMRNYLRGIFMSWPGPSYDYTSKSPFYDVYTTKENMQIVVRVQYACIIVFNFDEKIHPDAESLKLWQFTTAIKEKCAWVVSVFDIDKNCSKKLKNKNVLYKFNVSRMNFGDFVGNTFSNDYNPLFETNFMRYLLLDLDLSGEKSSNSSTIFHHFKHFILAVRNVLKLDEGAFFDILEGLFHDKSSYFRNMHHKNRQVHQFRSSSVYCVRVEKDKKIIQVNFMSADLVTEYDERINSAKSPNEKYDYQVISFFYKYDQNRGNFSFHMKVGVDFDKELFTRSLCYDSIGNEVKCPDYRKSSRQKRETLEKSHGIFMDIFYAIRRSNMNNIKESKKLALAGTFNSVIVDELQNSFYTLDDLISAVFQIDDTKAFVRSIKTMKTAWKLTKITLKAIAIGVGVPIIGLVLDVWEFKSSWENHQNGDQSALAVSELVTAGVFIATSFASLAIGVLTLAGFFVVPAIGWIIFAVGTVSFVTEHIWKIIDDPEAFKKFFSTLWDSFLSIPEFLSHPIEFLESQQAEDAKNVVNAALEIMEDNTMIQNVFSTPICRENMGSTYGCHDININFNGQYRYLKKDILSNTPNIPGKFANKYKKLCAFQTALGTMVKIFKTIHDPHGSVVDYGCMNALGVGRITNGIIENPVSLYMLHGNSTVHAIQDTASIFRISGGHLCTIFGGQKENTFILSSSFSKCLIVGHKYSINTVDLSELSVLNRYKILNGTSLEGLIGTNLKSIITMENIGIIIAQQHFAYSEFTIICSNVSLVIKKRKEILRYSSLYEINIERRHGCPYDLEITSHGSVDIRNHATNGKTVYTFPDVTGHVFMYLNNNRGRMAHSIMWKSIRITDIRNVSVDVLNLDRITYQISFMFRECKVTLALRDGTNSTQQMFADGSQLTFKNNTFIVDILFPKSKGQLWHTYGVLFDYFKGSSVELNAYSERDEEFFVLTENKIRINHSTMRFSLFKSNRNESMDRQTIKCKSGYNVILVMIACCESIQQILEKRAPWFDPLDIEMVSNPDVVIIDFTSLIDSVNHFKKGYTMEIMLTQNSRKQEVILDVFALTWDEDSKDRYFAGTIALKSNLIDDMLYERIKITAKSNFIFTRDDSTDRLRVVPLPTVVCPLSPVVVLDRHSVEENQVISFSDRSLPNYDLVELDPTTLLITDLVSNMAKSLIISQSSVPLLSVIVKNYKDDRMRTLTLKFERGLELKMDKMNENQMLKFHEFEKRFFYITERITEEKFTLEYDTRFDVSRNYDRLIQIGTSMTKPKVKSTSKSKHKPKPGNKPRPFSPLRHLLLTG